MSQKQIKRPTNNSGEMLSEALRLFGFQMGDEGGNGKQQYKTFAIPQSNDGAVTIQGGGIYGTYVDLEGVAKNEIELITRYREMSLQAECELAIDDVVNQAVVVEEQEPAVKINLDKVEGYSEEFKKSIIKEFKQVMRLLNFNEEGHDIFKRWYVDGRLYYHIMIDEAAPANGIQEIRYIDPRRIRKVREIRKRLNDQGVEVVDSVLEYYIYNERGINNTSSSSIQGVKIAVDSICFVPSGLIDSTRNMILSYLHKAIKPLNQLRMMEDALVIYRISRAPERRLFYIDVGNLPKLKAEQYVKDIMNKYRNKTIYDSATGEVRDDKKFMSMMEDYWLPRREGTKGTEIDTLPGGENLGEVTDVNFFQEKLYRSLGIPISRLKSEGGFNLGRSSEISRDEVKFDRFVTRIRKKFEMLFNNMLKTQLILKGIIDKDDWEEIKEGIFYSFLKDSHFSELADLEILNERLNAINGLYPLVGIFFSQKQVHIDILKRTEQEYEEVMKQMAKEKTLIPDQMEAEAEIQKDMMDMQGDQQIDMAKQQGDIQMKQAKDQMGLQVQGSELELKKLEAQTKLATVQAPAKLAAAKKPAGPAGAKKPAAKPAASKGPMRF